MKTQYDCWKEDHDQIMAEMAALGNAMKYTLEDALPNKYFDYIIDIAQVLDFHNARKWMSETYGYTEDLKKDLIEEAIRIFETQKENRILYHRRFEHDDATSINYISKDEDMDFYDQFNLKKI
jgi:hypothetical protein